jgi:DNA-directed RNA polymerase specialized sigma24 family protein
MIEQYILWLLRRVFGPFGGAIGLAENREIAKSEGIDKLPPAYRAVIQLRDVEGLGTAEAAARLGTNEAVVKTRLRRARFALRVLLEPEFGFAIKY